MTMQRTSALVLSLAFALSACSAAQPRPQSITLNAPLPALPTAAPTQTKPPTGWWQKAPGIEYTLLEAWVTDHREVLVLVRLEPARVALRVAYDPELPRTVRQWQQESGADVVVNAAFFDEQNRAMGLLIADGRSFGRSYRGFGGMFAWREDAPTLTWLRTTPYRPDPRITQAVQGFPMLVMDGVPVEGLPENDVRHRRTFVALDRRGRVLFGVTQRAQWRLRDLAAYLAQSELDIWRALNLDGGGSSGLWMSGAQASASVDSFTAVPNVVMVWAKQSLHPSSGEFSADR